MFSPIKPDPQTMAPSLFLFIVIIIEGYVVLSTELLAIRQLLPFVGSGTDTISIIIAAVLMPLAFGYYAGGQYTPRWGRRGVYLTYRKKLVSNILLASMFLLFGLSFVPLTAFFDSFITSGITHRLLLTAFYAATFLVMPIFLLGQTVPLVSNFFGQKKLAEFTGIILFFSTVGSFLGAVFSTLVVMSFFGVHVAVMLNFFLLLFLVILLEKPDIKRHKKLSRNIINMVIIALLAVILNAESVLRGMHVVSYNQYNMVRVFEDKEGNRHFSLNNNDSSMLTQDGEKHIYIRYIEDHYIKPIMHESIPPQEILVIGAGGFTLGLDDNKNHYTFIDIDGELKDLAEEHFLKEKLGENKTFEPLPARAFLTKTKKHYDLIVLDAYLGDISIPEHLVTKQFFEHVKSKLVPDGILIANFVVSPSFSSDFSKNIDYTLRSVFPFITRHVALNYNGWDRDPYVLNNVLYVYWNEAKEFKPHVYTDDKNTIYMDKPQGRPSYMLKPEPLPSEQRQEDEAGKTDVPVVVE